MSPTSLERWAACPFHYLVTEYPPGRQVVAVMHFSPASDFAAALTVGSIQHIVSLLIIVPAVLVVYRDIERGVRPTFLGTLRGIQERFVLMMRALVRPWARIFLAAVTIIGLPFAFQHFKFALIALAPFGQRVVVKP